MVDRGYSVWAKYSSEPVFRAMQRNQLWEHRETKTQIGALVVGGKMFRRGGFRQNVKTYSFEFVGKGLNAK